MGKTRELFKKIRDTKGIFHAKMGSILMDYSPPGSSVYGISQARILEWVLPTPGDLPHPGIEPVSPALAGQFFATEPPGKPCCLL